MSGISNIKDYAKFLSPGILDIYENSIKSNDPSHIKTRKLLPKKMHVIFSNLGMIFQAKYARLKHFIDIYRAEGKKEWMNNAKVLNELNLRLQEINTLSKSNHVDAEIKPDTDNLIANLKHAETDLIFLQEIQQKFNNQFQKIAKKEDFLSVNDVATLQQRIKEVRRSIESKDFSKYSNKDFSSSRSETPVASPEDGVVPEAPEAPLAPPEAPPAPSAPSAPPIAPSAPKAPIFSGRTTTSKASKPQAGRADFLADIAKGTKLKPVKRPENPTPEGKAQKSADAGSQSNIPPKVAPPKPAGGLMDEMTRKLAARNKNKVDK